MSVQLDEVQYGDLSLKFTVRRSKRRKHISVFVNIAGIEVAAPDGARPEVLRDLVRGYAPRLLGRQQRFVQLQRLSDPPKTWISGDCVRYLGRQYILKRIQATPNVAVLKGRFLELHAVDDHEARAVVQAWYVTQGVQVLPARVALWAERMGLPAPPVLIRDQRKRWGSCNAKGELRLNWRVMMMPWTLIDYVIAHELAHLLEPNHSNAFWVRLRQAMPDYRERRERLALEGSLFDG